MLQQHRKPPPLSRGDSAWGNSSSRMGMATPTPPAYAPPPCFCAMPLKQGEEQRTSRTVAATPARNDAGSPPPPDYNWASEQHQQREVFISDGESSIRSSIHQERRRVRAPSSPETAPRVNWAGFDKPSPTAGGRDLATRKCIFKIFVIFRGGWCTSSNALLKGFVELNPAIKRAGGKVVALSSQTPEQVGRVATNLQLPFQAFGDPTNGLIDEMNRRFKMDCTVSRNDMVTDAYPHGMAQPCVLAVYSDEAQDEGSVLFKWNRWQTIASMRHADAWAQTMKALSAKTEAPPKAEARVGGGGGGGPRRGGATPRSSQFAPFADHMVDAAAAVAVIPAPSTPRATAATVAAAAAAAEQRSPTGYRARTIEEAVDSALGVGWIKTGRDPAVSTARTRVNDVGGADRGATPRARAQTPRTRAPTPRARGVSGANTPHGAPGHTSRGGAFFPEAVGGAAAGGGEGYVDVRGSRDSRARERRVASTPRSAEESGERRRSPVTAGRKHSRPKPGSRPPVRPPSSAPSPAGALPPQHRRPTQEAVSQTRPPRRSLTIDGGGSGRINAPPPQPPPSAPQQQKKGGGASGSTRRFWFGPSNSRRSSFEEAAADFAEGGRGGGAKGKGFGSSPSGGGGGSGAPAGEFGEPAVPPTPGRRWGYLMKGARPPTPKPVAR